MQGSPKTISAKELASRAALAEAAAARAEAKEKVEAKAAAEDDVPKGKPGRPPKPQLERFTCNRFPGYKILGPKTVVFSEGSFATSDPEQIRAICNDAYFGIFIHADNLALHKKRER